MFSSSTFDAIKIEVAKAYDYWALTPEVQKVPFALLPDVSDFNFGKIESLEAAWKKLDLGAFNPKQNRAECITNIFNKMTKPDLIKQLHLFGEFMESDHFLSRDDVIPDMNYENLEKEQIIASLCNLTCVYRGVHAAGAINFHEGFKMKNYSVLKEFFEVPLALKNDLYGNKDAFEKLFKNVVASTGNDHMKKNVSFLLKVINKGVFQFLSPMHLRMLVIACESASESDTSLSLLYKEIQLLFQRILECFEGHFMEYEGFWLEKERFTLEELNKYTSAKRVMVTPEIEIVNKKAKIKGDFKVGNIPQKNGKYENRAMVGHTLIFDKDEFEDEKNEIIKLSDKEKGYVEKKDANMDQKESLGLDEELQAYFHFINDEKKRQLKNRLKFEAEKLLQAKNDETLNSEAPIKFVDQEESQTEKDKKSDANKQILESEDLQSFASSLGLPAHKVQGLSLHKLQGLTDAEIAVVKKCNVKFDTQRKTANKMLGIPGNATNETKEATTKPFNAKPTKIKNPYITFNRNLSPKKSKKAASAKKLEITGVRIRRTDENHVALSRIKTKDSRSFNVLVSYPVKAAEFNEQDSNSGIVSTSTTWKFCMCIRAENSRAKAKSWFEMKPEVNVNVHEMVYSMWDSNHKLLLGSSNVYTHCIVEGVKKIVQIRLSPEVNEPLETTTNSGSEIPVYQMAGICELTLRDDQDITSEINKVIEEYKNMIHDVKYKHYFKMAAWWTYCNADERNPARIIETVESEDYPDSLYERSIGSHTGGVYPYLVHDKGRVLTKVLPRVEVNARVGCALDEMFLNRDIRKVVEDMVGEYDEEYKSFVFKDTENYDDSFLVSSTNILN